MIETIIETWIMGGWVMMPIALLAVIMYSCGIYLLFVLKIKQISNTTDLQILEWIRNPDQSPLIFRHIFQYVTNSKNADYKMAEVESHYSNKIDKYLTFMLVLVACAPLLGLLGTVSGMIATFKGISAGGAASTIISKGISECLIATQTGITVSIPGMILSYWIRSKKSELICFLLRVESIALREYNIL